MSKLTKAGKKVGRKSKYTPALVEEICERLSKGEPLARICRDEHMPSVRAMSDWQRKDESISADIARARLIGEDYIADECLDIADNSTNDYMDKMGADGGMDKALNSEHIQRSKLRIDTRLKLLAKWNPKKWGDKVTNEMTGSNGAPLEMIITKRVVSPK